MIIPNKCHLFVDFSLRNWRGQLNMDHPNRAKSWNLLDAPGHRYEIRWPKSWRVCNPFFSLGEIGPDLFHSRLEVNGKNKRLSWQKVSMTPMPILPKHLSVMGDHTLGRVDTWTASGSWSRGWRMCQEPPGSYFHPLKRNLLTMGAMPRKAWSLWQTWTSLRPRSRCWRSHLGF